MTDQEREAMAVIALLAAFADGNKAQAERDQIRRIAETLDEGRPPEQTLSMASLYRDVLLSRVTLAQAAPQLTTPAMRQLAYELAVGVVDADGLRNAAETAFLEQLAAALALSDAVTEPTLTDADALATAPLATTALEPPSAGKFAASTDRALATTATTPATTTPATATPATATPTTATPTTAAPTPDESELNQTILNAAILNGALELLPQSLASMAIVPLQMRLVYGIGRRYGYTADRGHIRDLLATLGVGVTGQYLENVGRKLIGDLLGKVGGRMLKNVGRSATGVAFSFATTWAIGQVARRYYAGGRTMSAESLRDAFTPLLAEAKTLQSRYAPQIEDQSRRIDLPSLLQQVKGFAPPSAPR